MVASAAATRTGVLIIGAGFAGLGMGAVLRQEGNEDFLILERGASAGGTWRENVYPGIACDIPSHLYSYSFRQNPHWSRVFSPGPEIKHYLEWVAEVEGLTPHIRFNHDVVEMRWDGASELWRCRSGEDEFEAPVLVLACGRLSEPNFPSVPGLETFAEIGEGRASMHSARWRHDVEMEGKRVVVVGSGASAIQLVPELAAVAKELTVMQRSAPYVIPRDDRAYSRAERRMFARLPGAMLAEREAWFWQQETVFAQRVLVASEVEAARSRALDHLRAQVPDPKLRDQLTPGYEIGCKRVLLSDTYYPSFSRSNVTLVDSALAAVEGGEFVSADGRRVEVDIAVLATGFHSARQPYARLVFGEGGRALAEEWADGMYAHASISVPGFPNLFIVNGPNAGLGHNSAIVMIESQIEYVRQALSHLDRSGTSVLRVSRETANGYRAMIDEMSADTVWLRGGCESWYRDPGNGRLTLLWPGTAVAFREIAGRFVPGEYAEENSRLDSPALAG